MGMCIGAIRRNVNQIADLNRHSRARTAVRGFRSLTSRMVTQPQGVLLSNKLEVRKKDPCAGELVALKSHLVDRQSSVKDMCVEIGSRHS